MIFTLLLSCARCAVASSISNTISISFTVYAMHEHVCLWKSPCVYYVCLSFALKYLQFRNAFFVRFRINVGVQTQWFILKRIHRDKASERERDDRMNFWRWMEFLSKMFTAHEYLWLISQTYLTRRPLEPNPNSEMCVYSVSKRLLDSVHNSTEQSLHYNKYCE